MQNRYKAIVSSRNIYKEIDLSFEYNDVKVGTETDCDIRLRKDMFFEKIGLTFTQHNGEWTVFCSENLYLDVGDLRKLITKKLVHGDVFFVKYQNSNNDVFAVEFLLDFDNERRKYERAVNISNASAVRIGVDHTNNIIINSPYLNSDSVEMKRITNGYQLVVYRTTFGVYHNGSKANGTVIISNGDFFSVSDFIFYYKDGILWTEIRDGIYINGLSYGDYPEQNNYPKFNRNSRVKTIVNDEKIEILDPPAKPQKPKNNIFMKLLPSLGMLLASGVMAAFGGTMIIMSVISGLMAIFTSIMTVKESNKDYKNNIAQRYEKYTSYIEKKRTEILQLREQEKKELEEIYVSQDINGERFSSFSPDLFDRTPGDEDFLCVRLGSGAIDSKREINYKKQEKLEVEDELQLIPEQIYTQFYKVNDAPVVCDLKEHNAVGVVGPFEYRFDIFKNLVVDIVARQYYSDVKLVFVSNSEHRDYIQWLRLLPHVYSDEFGIRNIVVDDESKNVVFEHLYKELTVREQNKTYDENIVVFFFDEYGFKCHPVSKFVNKAKELGVTFVFFGDNTSDIPQGCGSIVSVIDSQNAILVKTENKAESLPFVYPSVSTEQMQSIVRLLAPVYTEEISLEGTLTKNISMFELLNILAVDDIDLENRWKQSQVFKSMAAPLGVSKTGVVSLDLHDKAHGPHGLVAGTTGSGKSEILQTYILAMATLFHPYEVGFVIIDFKGGGMVNQFKDLPHLMGAITNIDGKEIERSLKSIKAELQKRQRLFADADVNHIDKYIRKFKAGEVATPLPHLIIIVDEFAELKAEQPEFMKELISAARIGRSLGVHLILATQKPSGQVNEQIWSNSRFKLCLKVQSQEDSNEVLKSPLAAEIKEPGRAYLQVGNNEIFELFQSAYSGAPEKIDDTTVKEFEICSLTESGKRIPVFRQKRKKTDGSNTTQLESIVNYVASYCNLQKIERLPNICLPPLDDYITIHNEYQDYTLDAVPLGVYDDPDSQHQGFAKFNLCDDNTIIIGASQTGKTNLIQSIIRLVANKYSPKEAVFYIADFGAMYLKNFENLRHIGGVVTISEGERFKNLFKLLMQEIGYRKKKFMDCGLSSFKAYRDAGFCDVAHIFFIIDNFSAFKEVYADSYEDQFVYVAREGVSCGISIIVTNSTSNGLGYRYISNFANRLTFRCNDANEYMNIFDRCRMEPKDVPGRMLCKINKELYEMQSFIAFEGTKEIERSDAVKKYIESINAKYPDGYAKKIPSVPELLSFDYIDANYNQNRNRYQYPVALDYANVDVVAIDFKAWNEFCVVGKDASRKLAVTNNLLSAIHHNALSKPVSLYIIDGVERNLKSKADLGYVEKYTIDYSEISSIFDEIMPELDLRHQMLMDGDFDRLGKCNQIIIVINNKDAIEYISSTKEILDMYLRLVKQFKSLGVAFVFSDVDDAVVSYSGPELLKRFKETKKVIIASNIQEFKFCDIPTNAVRNNKTVNVGDVFMLDGSEITRIKMAEEVQK